MAETTMARMRAIRERLGLSLRDVSAATAVSFSTLARVERGEGRYSPETENRLRQWLGDDVPASIPRDEIRRAEELGAAIARGATREIMKIIREH